MAIACLNLKSTHPVVDCSTASTRLQTTRSRTTFLCSADAWAAVFPSRPLLRMRTGTQISQSQMLADFGIHGAQRDYRCSVPTRGIALVFVNSNTYISKEGTDERLQVINGRKWRMRSSLLTKFAHFFDWLQTGRVYSPPGAGTTQFWLPSKLKPKFILA